MVVEIGKPVRVPVTHVLTLTAEFGWTERTVVSPVRLVQVDAADLEAFSMPAAA